MAFRRILLAEDNATLHQIVLRALARAGWDVHGVVTGSDAAQLIYQEEFDLLVTDMQMPGDIDGITLAHLARKKWPTIPIVFISGSPTELARATDFGPPLSCLAKPFRIARFVTTVRQLLGAAGSASGR